MEALKIRLDFPNPIVQAQALRRLVAAVLKEKDQNGKISQSSTKGSALETLWEQCCNDCDPVRSTCCDSIVLLVDQGHAELQDILNSVLNLLPSARDIQGLVKLLGKLLQMQADRRNPDTCFTCPYGIRSGPHPYITALENRPDCWTAILSAIDDFVRQAIERNEPAYIAMLVPFLCYLYCDPERRSEHGLLRQGLLQALLPADPWKQEQDGSLSASDTLIQCLCQLVPGMPMDRVEDALELHWFIRALLPHLAEKSQEPFKSEKVRLLVQLLCACQRCLGFSGDCRPLVGLMGQLIPTCRQEVPLDELLIGVALLLFEAPAAQQSSLLSLVLTLQPEHTELSQWLSPVLILPVLQLMSCSDLTEPLAERRTHNLNQKLAQSVLRSVSRPTAGLGQAKLPEALLFTPFFSELRVAVSILHQAADPSAAVDWLLSLTSALSSNQRLPNSLVLVVSHLLLTGQDDVCRLALDAVRAVAAADPHQVPSLLPLLLFKLGKENNPCLSHAVLECLPNLGTHKICVPMVLQTLGLLASDLKLKAVAMRLTTDLWKKQDRVYPELQRLLAQPDNRVVMGRDTQWEQVLARAACLRDICRERPYQHGSDMLAAIVLTLKQCTKLDQVTPAVLALQGLQELCRAEVVDIVSMWRNLGPDLRCDSRPLVVKVVSQLLALVPQLAVKSEEYELLKEEAVSFLWNYTMDKDPEVVSCGFRSLADFPESVHTVNHLPEAARPAVQQPEPEDGELAGKGEEKDLSVTGSSYVKLLTLTPSPALPALELFLTSLVRQEMSQMPRGVYFSALRGGSLRSDQGKTLAGIPAFMLKTYEKNKQPGLKPGLAAGLLLCYELPQQTDCDGRPIHRHLLSRSRSYQQTLTALIHEVNIQLSEWHRVLLLPQAWRGFMNRTFHAVLEGRRADLEMQNKKRQEDQEELQYKKHCAWLWTRDHLTDAIRGATKDSPMVQGNSVLALSALAAVLAKYERNLPADNDGGFRAGPEFVPTSSWLAMVLDTLFSIISSSYKAKGQVFPWYLHRSYSGENTASAIARSCASLALSLLVPVLVLWHQDSTKQVVSTLRAGLTDESQPIRFHSGLALGMVLSGLHHQRLSDISPEKNADLLLDAIAALEACSFDSDADYNTGCLLGLGLVLSALCDGGQTHQRDRVIQTLDRLHRALQDSSEQGRMLQEVLAYSVACVSVSAFGGSLVESGKVDQVMDTLRSLTEDSQQTPGFALALGLAVHGLSLCGHGKAEDLQTRLLAAWVKILLAEGCPTMQRLAAVNGLVAAAGSESYLIQLKSQLETSSNQQSRLNEVIRAISQIVSFSGAIGLQSNCACLLGHLYLSHISSGHSHTAVPQDFTYLPEKSIIRAIVDLLSEAGKKGPEFAHPSVVQTALASLASVASAVQYPPVNWGMILSPLMRLSFGEEVQHQCVALAAAQAQYSQSASLFLGSWLSSPLVYSLSYQTRALLNENLSSWMKHVAEDKLQFFVETLGLQAFQEDLGPQRILLGRTLLRGLAQAMATPDPPAACWAVLTSATEKIFKLLPDQIKDSDVDFYVGVAECLSAMADSEIDRIASVTETQMEKTCFVLAYLVSLGRIPLLGLNDVIASVLRGRSSHRVGWILLQTFYQCRLAASVNTGVSKRMEWLLELMGLMRNIAYGTTAVTYGDAEKATDFLFQVFAAAVVSWGDHSAPLLFGIRHRWAPRRPESKSHALYGADSLAESALPRCLLGLPRSLPALLDKEPWSQQSRKFVDWLLGIVEGPRQSLSATTVDTARVALLALRSSPEFKKKSVWTRAYGW
ncbi:focadhesin isoform X2 [Corythoichthys intestinalis]|uniref:focadhesin isoform X2 n=1 Tax=Corythoichthys intestinalis TaxID=161448 RepID=UPI0025A4F2AC|nr:focadhesin isoform X2 [Corythoichthys intestinalis]XP_061810722.1 focadhesin-like isoform X2 [Nerophis lumbriciformis]